MTWQQEKIKVTPTMKLQQADEIKKTIKNRIEEYKKQYEQSFSNVEILNFTPFKGEIVPIYKFRLSRTVYDKDSFFELIIIVEEISEEGDNYDRYKTF